jgi:hypothetical protein
VQLTDDHTPAGIVGGIPQDPRGCQQTLSPNSDK